MIRLSSKYSPRPSIQSLLLSRTYALQRSNTESASTRSPPRNQVKSNPIKTRLRELVDNDHIPKSSRQIRLTQESNQRKQKAEFSIKQTELTYLITPFLNEYFANINKVLEQKSPKFLSEKIAVGKYLNIWNLKQLENSFTVDRKAGEFLEQGELGKAIHVCRMAKAQGAVGMNRILKYVKTEKNDLHLAEKIWNNMKKWGCIGNERTLVIMATSKHEANLTAVEVQKLLKTYDIAMKKRGISPSAKTILSNTLLENLVRNAGLKKPEYAIAFYHDIPERGKFSRDNNTYTTMFNLISHQPLPLAKEIIDLRKSMWAEIEERKENDAYFTPDSKLFDAYCNSLSLQTGAYYFKLITEVYKKYFTINLEDDDQGKNKFPFSARQFDIVLKSALNTESYLKVLNLFDKISENHNIKLDNLVYNNLLKVSYLYKHSYVTTKKILDHMIDSAKSGNEKAVPTSSTIYSAFRNFLKYKGQEQDLQYIEDLIHVHLPELQVKIDEPILSSYIAVYTKCYRDSFGKKPSAKIGTEALEFIHKHQKLITDVTGNALYATQIQQDRIRKAVLNASNICSFILDHADNKNANIVEISWIKEFKKKLVSVDKEILEAKRKKKEEAKLAKKEKNEDEDEDEESTVN